MKNEIERKFLIKELPDLSGITPRRYERYFLEISPVEKRIQKVDDSYIYEEKSKVSELERSRDEKKKITEEEFNNLKQNGIGPLIRERFDLPTTPEVSIQIYKDKFEGLIRAEVEFASTEEAEAFVPFPWMGKEITSTLVGKDSKLVNLDREEFEEILKDLAE